jgi:hypothetical protein
MPESALVEIDAFLFADSLPKWRLALPCACSAWLTSMS